MTQITQSLWGTKVMCGQYKEQLQAFFKGCKIEEKARRSSFEVSEMQYIAILICQCHLANESECSLHKEKN